MNRLRITRFRAGMTGKALAEKSGVSRKTIALLEEGQKPQAPTAVALANALGVDVVELFPGEFSQSPSPDEDVAA